MDPPDTMTVSPVIYEASSDTKTDTIPAHSSDFPNLKQKKCLLFHPSSVEHKLATVSFRYVERQKNPLTSIPLEVQDRVQTNIKSHYVCS